MNSNINDKTRTGTAPPSLLQTAVTTLKLMGAAAAATAAVLVGVKEVEDVGGLSMVAEVRDLGTLRN